MRIQSLGNYSTRAHDTAVVEEFQESHCVGKIFHANGNETPSLWKIEDSTKIGGPSDDDLVQFIDTGRPSPVDR
ncbi:hypothetical protein HNQ77_001048 [Silvibacterium bohemicum]|uniref:Uncharacterized protein n=1 Tax=Silvibacterium bohemicum TaxID=1577686 RepID=A0A841JYQ9_9BACT|nr:hypothetical protein [Silvibacterium bohemicum]MBB6143104.1 hypothetical protein [Silvibacterium bohemicum]